MPVKSKETAPLGGKKKYILPHQPNHVKPTVGRKPKEAVPGHSASRGK